MDAETVGQSSRDSDGERLGLKQFSIPKFLNLPHPIHPHRNLRVNLRFKLVVAGLFSFQVA